MSIHRTIIREIENGADPENFGHRVRVACFRILEEEREETPVVELAEMLGLDPDSVCGGMGQI